MGAAAQGVSRAVTEREVQELAGHSHLLWVGVWYGPEHLCHYHCDVRRSAAHTSFRSLFFIVKTGIDRYNFFYVWPYHAGNGDLGLTAIHCLGIGLILMQVCVTGYFVYWGNTFQAIAVATLLVGTSTWGAGGCYANGG